MVWGSFFGKFIVSQKIKKIPYLRGVMHFVILAPTTPITRLPTCKPVTRYRLLHYHKIVLPRKYVPTALYLRVQTRFSNRCVCVHVHIVYVYLYLSVCKYILFIIEYMTIVLTCMCKCIMLYITRLCTTSVMLCVYNFTKKKKLYGFVYAKFYSREAV